MIIFYYYYFATFFLKISNFPKFYMETGKPVDKYIFLHIFCFRMLIRNELLIHGRVAGWGT